jgi:hypothetical protein
MRSAQGALQRESPDPVQHNNEGDCEMMMMMMMMQETAALVFHGLCDFT